MWDRVERLIGKENLALLAKKRVGVVGLGSGGGFVAQSLAMSGVENFVLIDDDILEATNIVRHVADNRYLGQPKADVVADLIRQRNPKAEISTRVGRIEQHMDALDDLDLLIVGVDGEQVKYIINEACLERDLVAIYAGVYERGEGGDVVIIYPYDGPCYACWSAAVREEVQLTNEVGELDYGMIGPEGTLEAEPALWLHVVRVALTQTDFALKFLLKETDQYSPLPTNTVILANNAIEIIAGEFTPPHSALWVQIDRDPHCLVCGDQMQTNMTDSQTFHAVSLQDLADETGISVDADI
ncbi:MAG: ThiF family adenylyltransferase [Phototrophicales bacterium]|nr:ThiF family adenylyltransferase [Phototrophicales bacterium]